MSFTGILSATILILGGIDYVACQAFDSTSDIQSFLNQFCFPGSTNDGCNNSSIVRDPTVVAQPAPSAPRPPGGCFPNERRCLQNICVPNNIDCSVLNSGVTCLVPDDYGLKIQVLLCGDGKPSGIRCGTSVRVPVLTVLIAQCQGSNSVNPRPVSSLDVLNGPGDDGGAGVYLCSPSGTWESKFESPFIKQLIVSCRNAGCGRVPQPSDSMPIHRRWAWVRGIYRGGELHCVGTLVSPNALVTAAHCVTRSVVTNQVDPDIDNYQIELPGPNSETPIIKIRPEVLRIHPRYSYNNGKRQNDLAIIFFDFAPTYNLPIVCITDRRHVPTSGRTQVVFNLQDGSRQQDSFFGGVQDSGPNLEVLKATWDNTCISTSTRLSGRCVDTLQVQQSQFCASHKGATSLIKGSSGGPYLAEVGNDAEVWVLMGVLSSTTRVSDGDSCFQEHSVYGQVADNSRWIKDCVFDRRCGFA